VIADGVMITGGVILRYRRTAELVEARAEGAPLDCARGWFDTSP
jgi:hypothetical protein